MPRRRSGGFSLLELVVSIAVVALLLGMLLPGLARAAAAGRSAECLSNLRQMATAAQLYAAVFDAWPAAVRYELVGGSFHQVAWDWVTTPDGTLVSPGPLWSFSDDPGRVQQCPEYLGTTNFADPFTGYNYNTSYVGDEETWAFDGEGSVRAGTPPHAGTRSATCAMFGDGGRAGGTNKFMRAPLDRERLGLAAIYGGGQAFRHLGGTNVAYVDGHVATAGSSNAGPLATDELLDQVMGFPENGFLSADDRAYDPR